MTLVWRDAANRIPPGSFAFVMATGIVSTPQSLTGWTVFSLDVLHRQHEFRQHHKTLLHGRHRANQNLDRDSCLARRLRGCLSRRDPTSSD